MSNSTHDALIFFANEDDPFPHVLLADPRVTCPACEALDIAPVVCARCDGSGQVPVSAFTRDAIFHPPSYN